MWILCLVKREMITATRERGKESRQYTLLIVSFLYWLENHVPRGTRTWDHKWKEKDVPLKSFNEWNFQQCMYKLAPPVHVLFHRRALTALGLGGHFCTCRILMEKASESVSTST